MGEDFVSRYSRIVRKHVWNFVKKNAGHMNSVMFDADDLYQECMSYLLDKYIKSNKSIDDFRFNENDLKHVMCLYTQKQLPVNHPNRTTNYSETIRSVTSQEYITSKHDRPMDQNNDVDYRIDCDLMMSRLDEQQKKVFDMMLHHYTRSQIIEKTGMTDMAYRFLQRKLARKMIGYFGQVHEYYGGTA